MSEGVWVGKCIDDGTGRNVFYINSTDGSKTRMRPSNFVPETLENSERKFYFRGNCVRCRKQFTQCVISKDDQRATFSLNLCDPCILLTSMIDKIPGNGQIIWDAHIDSPKTCFHSLVHPPYDRDALLLERSREARESVQIQAKIRRNQERSMPMRALAANARILKGKYVSWGYGKLFDEYYGPVNEKNRPHGFGMKIYSDGSVYVGEFANGKKETEGVGTWTRPDNSTYEGSWVKDFKHGKGVQIYPDGSKYEGEYAKGMEHGKGLRTYSDGSTYSGRFRFGKRDGPGVFTRDLEVIKQNFKDSQADYLESPVPQVSEEDDPDQEYVQPKSLLSIVSTKIASLMHFKREYVSSTLIQRRACDHLKPLIAAKYFDVVESRPNKALVAEASRVAFKFGESSLRVNSIPISGSVLDGLTYFVGANTSLQTLQLTSTKLQPTSYDIIARYLKSQAWPHLETLDLSFNRISNTSMQTLVSALSDLRSLHTLKFVSCYLTSNEALLISTYLETNETLLELDLAFNTILTSGTELIAASLTRNHTLTSLNLRRNEIGDLGAAALANALKVNTVLSVLCVVDNKVGLESIAAIAGRLNGSVGELCHSFRVKELTVPVRYQSS